MRTRNLKRSPRSFLCILGFSRAIAVPSACRRRVWPAAGYAVCVSLSPCRVCDTGPSIVAHTPSRLLGRLNDQTFATLSAVRYGLVRRIGFLFMPPMSCIGGSLPATVRLIGRVSQIW